jgi:hypothetical protein
LKTGLLPKVVNKGRDADRSTIVDEMRRVAPLNSFLLCTVLAKQRRRLGRLLPDRRIAELITIALTNCADYELALDLGPGVPEVVRAEAMQIGRLTRRPEPSVASGHGRTEGSQSADVIAAVTQGAGEVRPPGEAGLFGESTRGAHISVGSSIDSFDSRSDLFSVQRKHSISKSNGADLTRLRQLQAMVENLCTLASRHRENHNYVVAHALYGRALSVALEIRTPEKDGNALVMRIRKDQQAVFELLSSGENLDKPPLEKAKEVGR